MTTRSRAVSISTNPESGGNSSETFGNSGIARGRTGSACGLTTTSPPLAAAGSADAGTSERWCL
jgi:hypothetical protein